MARFFLTKTSKVELNDIPDLTEEEREVARIVGTLEDLEAAHKERSEYVDHEKIIWTDTLIDLERISWIEDTSQFTKESTSEVFHDILGHMSIKCDFKDIVKARIDYGK